MKIDCTSYERIRESLEIIAKELILSTAININGNSFSIIDLEIYFWHRHHQDDYARGVPHCREKGNFEVHRYGIDISLGNKMDEEFGGILICGLFDLKNRVVIGKSSVVKNLFNKLENGKNSIQFIKHDNPWDGIFKSKRLNLGEPREPNELIFKEVLYKYIAKDVSLFKNYKNKEVIFKESNLSDLDIQKLLGYKFKRYPSK